MPDGNPLVDDTNRRIVQALANGATYEQVAAEVHISRSAVMRRTSRLRARVGVSTTPQLIALALRRRWIS